MSLYGTRDAAMNWQEEIVKELRKLGSQRRAYNPCLYDHQERNLRTFLHGDDFATVGAGSGVKWFRGCLEKRFEIKTQVIGVPEGKDRSGEGAVSPSGPAPTIKNGELWTEGTEGRLLNRVVRCTAQGWEFGPDQKHADLIVQELGLHNCRHLCRGELW